MPLEAKDITFGYRGRAVLSGVSLGVQPGEVVGLTGHSGRGKTTLARIIAGHIRPASGSVTVGGAAIRSFQRRPVQLVFQHPEKAVDPRWHMGRVVAESWTPGHDVLDELGIAPEWLHRFPSELSGGELQRFCVARALAPQTRYLIADEMTTMLDAITQAQLWAAVLRRVKEQHLGVLIISHEQPLVRRVCDRVVEL